MPELETKIVIQEQKGNYTSFTIEPLRQGFGHTLGNALRRVLLSELPGAAISRVKIAGISHEFSTIAGIKEDTVELLLNLKKINFLMTKKQPTIVTLEAKGPAEVKAGDFSCPTGIEVVNKDQIIAHLADAKSNLQMEITVEYGRGYRLSESGTPIGVIAVDSNFSPVLRVNYRVEATRVGRVTNLDRLILEVWTNGAFKPNEALQQAAAILVEQFQVIAKGREIEKIEEGRKIETPKEVKAVSDEGQIFLEELNLPTRIVNTLKRNGVETLAQLESKSEEELKKIKHIGPKTIVLLQSKAKREKKAKTDE